MIDVRQVFKYLEATETSEEEETTIWFFHIVPPLSAEYIKEKGYLEGKYGRMPLHFSLGSQEGLFVTHIVTRRRYEEPDYTYADFMSYQTVYAVLYSYFKQQHIPLRPVFYSVSLKTHEVKYPDYHISWWKLLPEMEIWVPPGYRVPLEVCEQVGYSELMSKLEENPRLYDLDRRITKFFYKIVKGTYWSISRVWTFDIKEIDEMTPEEKQEIKELCDEWNSIASEITGIPCPPDIHQREYR